MSFLVKEAVVNGGDPNAPLKHKWTFWIDQNMGKGITETEYESAVQPLGSFTTITDFIHLLEQHPAELVEFPDTEGRVNVRLFKDDIKPLREDEKNAGGGEWLVMCSKNGPHKVRDLFSKVMLAALGGAFDFSSHICGVVMSLRPSGDRIGIWVDKQPNPRKLNQIKQHIREVLGADAYIRWYEHAFYLQQDHSSGVSPAASPSFQRKEEAAEFKFGNTLAPLGRGISRQKSSSPDPPGRRDFAWKKSISVHGGDVERVRKPLPVTDAPTGKDT
eukprot:Colp12_sorted_trinity150504_noHs@33322